jgi:hypothetical protein
MPSDSSQDRDQQILSRLARIEHKVDSLDQTTAFALRAESEKHFGEAKKIFGRSIRRAQVYLAANGQRSVEQIATFLRMQRQNVGPNLKLLNDEGLLEIIDTTGGRDIWSKKSVDRTLRISHYLCKEFPLSSDGRRVTKKKPKKTRKGSAKKKS